MSTYKSGVRQESFHCLRYLKGHSQLMHMRIKCHKTSVEQKLIRNTLNKPCKVELVTSEIVIIDPKPHQSTYFLYNIENSPMDFSREAKHRQILLNSNISRGEKLHEVWVIVLCGRFTVENA